MGVCDAPDDSTGGNRGVVVDNPPVFGRTDDHQLAVFKRAILGGSICHGSFFPFH